MKKQIVLSVVIASLIVNCAEAGFWNTVGSLLGAAAQPAETAESVIRANFDDQLKEISALSDKANGLAEGARTRLNSIKASYAALEATYAALFPAAVTNDVSTKARETLAKVNSKINEGELVVVGLTEKANRMTAQSIESAALEHTDENLVKIQEIAQAMFSEFTALKAEDKSLANLINIALIQLASLNSQEEK